MGEYVFGHEWECELRRLQLVEEVMDPGTVRHLEATGVSPGWRCLEVGGGAGSIARWLCQRVGPTGRVVATDVETDFLGRLSEPNLEIRRHDIVTDELEGGAFDLVHSRMVLQHLPERDRALKRMAAALAPGGVLVEEDMDCSSLVGAGAGAAFFEQVLGPIIDLMRAAGYDPDLGRRLPSALSMQGLSGIGAEGRIPVGLYGSPAGEMWRLTVERFQTPLLAQGRLSQSDLERLLALHDDEDFSFLFPAVVAAWGRRPS